MTNSVSKRSVLITQANELEEVCYNTDLTVAEHHILNHALEKLKNTPEDFPSTSFYMKDFLDECDLRGNVLQYDDEMIFINGLINSRLEIETEERISVYPWLSSTMTCEEMVELTFNYSLKEILLKGRLAWLD